MSTSARSGRRRSGVSRLVEGAGSTPAAPTDRESHRDVSEAARTIALRSLNAAPRTRAQLADLLASRGVPDAVSQECLDRFTELGLIDDGEYARSWVRSRHQTRQLPRRALRYELQRKGVHEDHIEAALELIDEDDELAAATLLAQRKARATENMTRHVRTRRVMGALMRRGYSADVAARAVAAALEADEDVADWTGA